MSHKRKNRTTRSFNHPREGAGASPADGECGSDAREGDAPPASAATPCPDEPECQAPDAPPPVPVPEGETGEELRIIEPEAAEATEEPPRPEAGTDELEKLRAERDSYLDLARRERADFDNYRKRVQREMAGMKRESLAGFLKDFFGPLEDMHRVLRESEKEQSFDALLGGVRIMEENFRRALTKAGVRQIDAKGKPFDPALHEAMAAVPAADVPPNTIIEVYENGYTLDDFILRPARVIVSSAPAE